MVIALAGNKADLEARRKVDFEEAHQYAEDNDILHLETSAKTAVNVKDLFVAIAKRLPKNSPQPERGSVPNYGPGAAKKGWLLLRHRLQPTVARDRTCDVVFVQREKRNAAKGNTLRLSQLKTTQCIHSWKLQLENSSEKKRTRLFLCLI